MSQTDLDNRPLSEGVARRKAVFVIHDLRGQTLAQICGQRRLAQALLDTSANGLRLHPGDTIACLPPTPNPILDEEAARC